MQHVSVKIANAQEEYDKRAGVEDEKMADGITALTDACKRNKENIEEELVNTIIG